MDRFETEEQQVEAIKQFFKDNGMAIGIGIVLGIGGLSGWRFYTESQIEAKEQASAAYQQGLEQLIENEDDTKISSMLTEHKDSAYSSLANLVIARQAMDKDDPQGAIAALQSVTSVNGELADIARLRLAQVHFEIGNTNDALNALEQINSAAFDSQKFELKGDILYADQQFDAAESAFNQALVELPGDPNIQMKLDNIAYARAQAQTESTQEASSQGE